MQYSILEKNKNGEATKIALSYNFKTINVFPAPFEANETEKGQFIKIQLPKYVKGEDGRHTRKLAYDSNGMPKKSKTGKQIYDNLLVSLFLFEDESLKIDEKGAITIDNDPKVDIIIDIKSEDKYKDLSINWESRSLFVNVKPRKIKTTTKAEHDLDDILGV